MTTTTTTRWGRNQRYQFQKQKQQQQLREEQLTEQEQQAYKVFAELYRRKANNPFLFEHYIKAKDETAKALKDYEANETRIKELQKRYSKILGYKGKRGRGE